jgi:hypothetical protein
MTVTTAELDQYAQNYLDMVGAETLRYESEVKELQQLVFDGFRRVPGAIHPTSIPHEKLSALSGTFEDYEIAMSVLLHALWQNSEFKTGNKSDERYLLYHPVRLDQDVNRSEWQVDNTSRMKVSRSFKSYEKAKAYFLQLVKEAKLDQYAQNFLDYQAGALGAFAHKAGYSLDAGLGDYIQECLATILDMRLPLNQEKAYQYPYVARVLQELHATIERLRLYRWSNEDVRNLRSVDIALEAIMVAHPHGPKEHWLITTKRHTEQFETREHGLDRFLKLVEAR